MDEQTAKFVENIEMIKALLDCPEFISKLPIGGGFVLLILRGMYESTALKSFGKLDLTAEEVQWTLGTVLRDLGRTLRKERPSTLKGRANAELLEILRTIRTHQVKKLKPKELRAALEFAGVHVPNDEALRLFEWRAKKKGQL